MAFCINCGHQLVDGAKFCANCGVSIERNISSGENERKTVFDGEIHKCPKCGWELKSFDTVCPNPQCGIEIRGRKVSSAISELVEKLEKATTENQRIIIVKNFPVPNTKEDIFEFMFLASSNFDASYYATHLYEEDISDAWLTKIEQCYQKAKISIINKFDFEKVQTLYTKIIEKIDNVKTEQKQISRRKYLKEKSIYIPNILITTGWIISLLILIMFSSINTDSVGFNASQLIAIIDLIAGCFFIPKVANCESLIPKLITTIGLVFSVVILIILSTINLDSVGFNACQLLLVIDIIVSIIICDKLFRKNK